MFDGLNSHDLKFQPYIDAMNLLSQEVSEKESGKPDTRGLPFYPLPEEMPQRQYRTKPGAKLTEDPTDEDKELTYAAAISSLSLIESYFELIYNTPATAMATR